MVTARIAGLSPGTSPPPVRIPIRPFLVLMRPLCRFLRPIKGKIDGSDWMYKRHRSEPAGKLDRCVRTRSRIQRDGQAAEVRGAELGKRSINTARGGSAEWAVNALTNRQ